MFRALRHATLPVGFPLSDKSGDDRVRIMGNSAQLMLPQGDGRVHSSKSDMAAIVFTGPGGVHFFIVLAHQRLPPFRVLPNPIPKGIPDRLLLLRCQGGLLGILISKPPVETK